MSDFPCLSCTNGESIISHRHGGIPIVVTWQQCLQRSRGLQDYDEVQITFRVPRTQPGNAPTDAEGRSLGQARIPHCY